MVTKLGPLCEVKLLKKNVDKAVERLKRLASAVQLRPWPPSKSITYRDSFQKTWVQLGAIERGNQWLASLLLPPHLTTSNAATGHDSLKNRYSRKCLKQFLTEMFRKLGRETAFRS
jgi:hypothetical protein